MKPDTNLPAEPRPGTVSRIYPASLQRVFFAWTMAENLKTWFCPDGFSVGETRVEFRIGGAVDVCIQTPDHEVHRVRGHIDLRRAIDRTLERISRKTV